MSNFRRGQNLAHPTKTNIITLAVGVMIAMIVILQIWLLTATLDTVLGGNDAIAWPSLIMSLLLFLVAVRLFYFIPKSYTWKSEPDKLLAAEDSKRNQRNKEKGLSL